MKGQKGDQGGEPKLAKINHGVKPDIIKRAAQKANIFGGVKFQHFGPFLRPKKVLLTAEKVVGPKLTKISGGVKHGWAAQKKPKFKRGKTVCWVDINFVQKNGLKFHQMRSNAIILYDTLPDYCIPRFLPMQTGDVKNGLCST